MFMYTNPKRNHSNVNGKHCVQACVCVRVLVAVLVQWDLSNQIKCMEKS